MELLVVPSIRPILGKSIAPISPDVSDETTRDGTGSERKESVRDGAEVVPW